MTVAVIVCFRVQQSTDRSGQLQLLLQELGQVKLLEGANIVVATQSAGQQFNRGQVLNRGAAFARKYFRATNIIFHDVDLLPSESLHKYYGPTVSTVHIACNFERYANPRYFGGIVNMPWNHVAASNAFPNGIWGWGGEDDALLRRCERVGVSITKPRGGVRDIEGEEFSPLSLHAKQHQLRTDGAKCNNKRECVAWDEFGWSRDGINAFVECEVNEPTSYLLTKKHGLAVHYCVFPIQHIMWSAPP